VEGGSSGSKSKKLNIKSGLTDCNLHRILGDASVRQNRLSNSVRLTPLEDNEGVYAMESWKEEQA
jgi:hypothetical protein